VPRLDRSWRTLAPVLPRRLVGGLAPGIFGE
jgi:hypothetical protein